MPCSSLSRSHDSESVIVCAQMRHKAMASARQYFYQEDFWEIDAPHLIRANAVELHIDPIPVTVHTDQMGSKEIRYLHSSPEIYHKRLLSYGATKIFQLSHVFRDGESTRLHLPEFSLLEWYRASGSLCDLIADCEKLFPKIALSATGSSIITTCSGAKIDLTDPFEHFTLEDLFQKYAKIDLRQALTEMSEGNDLSLVSVAKERGFSLRPDAEFEDAFYQIMSSAIESAIGQSSVCVVNKWPTQMAGLAKVCEGDHLFADRFEIYCGGIELANAFAELTDPIAQERRFKNDLEARVQLGKMNHAIDQEFIRDLAYMPPSSGIAVGFDRLLMLITGCREITKIYPLRI